MQIQIQKQQSLIPIEIQLLKQKHSDLPRLTTYLPQQSKLYFTLYRKQIFIQSTPDRFRYIRLICFMLLRDSYVKFQQQQRETLRHIKNVLFGQNSNSDTPRQLKKKTSNVYLAHWLSNIPIRQHQTTQKHLIQLFNNQPYFDKAIVIPFKQAIQLQQINIQDGYDVKQWFQRNFNLKLPSTSLNKYQKIPIDYRIIINQKRFLIQSMRIIYSQPSQQSFSFGSSRNINKEQQIIQLTLARSNLKNSSPSNIKVHQFNVQKKKKTGFWEYFCCRQ